ncbi:hypothetical protein XENTR_v10015325 [Xenopus tropicalis]|nr:hypothetical protein XENTR_v10015325 [Xenopus tropicalis]
MAVGRSSERRPCGFGLEKGPRQLMRVGITLIFVGHVNFILGAIVHGTVLRHVANPEKRVSPEYCAANIISVVSGLLSISTGICAILASRNLRRVQIVSARHHPGALVSLHVPVGGGGGAVGSVLRGCVHTARDWPLRAVVPQGTDAGGGGREGALGGGSQAGDPPAD